MRRLAPLLLAAGSVTCHPSVSAPPAVESPSAGQAPTGASSSSRWVGSWRAVLDSPGGELAFDLAIADEEGLAAVVYNGDERLPFTSIEAQGNTLHLRIDGYDSDIVATLSADGTAMHGEWSKTGAQAKSTLAFHAYRTDAPRYQCTPTGATPSDIGGTWAMNFVEDDGQTFVGQAEFVHDAHSGDLRGTILTDTGDYRYLAGCYGTEGLVLSVFDGAHAFLFRATANAQGQLHGDFWSRDSYHARFDAQRAVDGSQSVLADPYAAVRVTSPDQRVRFAFPDLDGNVIRSDDPRFAGRVVVIELFGTWCPNCNDQAPILASWYDRYRDDGLEVIGLAFEYTGDAQRDREYLRKYKKRHGITYPLLLAGTSDKDEAHRTLPELSDVAAFPTTIFVGRDGRVHTIYSGFFGPATGPRYANMLAEHEALLQGLLAATP